MRRSSTALALLVALLLLLSTTGVAQEVLDGIAARVDTDIILVSEVRTLSRYQALVQGKPETDAKILDRLIDQWLVRVEADNAHFPRPTDVAIARGLERVRASFDSDREYEMRKKEVGLTDTDIRSLITSQLYLSNYLESRFRPAVQIDPKEVEEFYQSAIVSRAKSRNQAPPALDASRDYIEEALLQRGINEQAERWLKESRSRLHIEIFLKADAK